MKKIILVLILINSINLSFAQEVKFGAKLGLNVSSASFVVPAGITQSSILGINVGFFADFKVTDKFYIQPELLYSMQGTEISAANGAARITGTSTINYINVPIMAKFYVVQKFSIQAGPQLGFVISAKDELVSNVSGFPSSSRDAKSDYNSVDFGINFGIGFDFTKKFFVDTRYNLGLSQIVKNLPANNDGGKNRVFSINFGYKF